VLITPMCCKVDIAVAMCVCVCVLEVSKSVRQVATCRVTSLTSVSISRGYVTASRTAMTAPTNNPHAATLHVYLPTSIPAVACLLGPFHEAIAVPLCHALSSLLLLL